MDLRMGRCAGQFSTSILLDINPRINLAFPAHHNLQNVLEDKCVYYAINCVIGLTP